MSLLIPMTMALSAVSMQEAVETALANHPSLAAAHGQTDVAEARSRQARASLLPQIGGSTHYDLSTRNSPTTPRNRGGSYSGSLDASILVTDFGRSWKEWDAAKASADATELDARFTERDVVAGVRLAFIDALEAKALAEVARETQQNQEKHRTEVAEFVNVGLRPKIDLTRLETEVADARAAVARAENDYRSAKATLNQAMGRSGTVEYDVVEPTWSPLVAETQPVEALATLAFDERPDLAGARRSIQASQLSASATSRRYLPSLSAGVGAGFSGEDFDRPGWSAFAGLSLSWNIFDGLATPAAIDAADAETRIEEARLNALEQQVRVEVEQAKIGIDSAKAQLEAAEQTLTSARELVALAEERYTQGVGSSLELADAQLELSSASAQRVRVEYDLASARALLLRSLGRAEWN